MTTDDAKALVRRYVEQVWNAGQPALPFFAPDYRRYLAATAPPLTGAEQQARSASFRAAFPDLHFTIHDLLAKGDRVVFRATIASTHRGMFRGIAAIGRPITINVLDVVRIADGRFAEQWGGPDLFDLLQQLGASE